MDTFGIRARFPLGTYTGHRADGGADRLPDPARLFSALVHAAGTGSTAVLDGDRLRPSPEAIAAFAWLEENPPTGLDLPDTVPLTHEPVVAYRREGVIPKEGGRWTDKVTRRAQGDGSAVGGVVGWAWKQAPPPEIAATIDALCADVGCLGEGDSPVILETGPVTGAWVASARVSRFSPVGRRVRVPGPGRFETLETAHRAANPDRVPTAAQGKHGTGDRPITMDAPLDGLREVRFVRPARPTGKNPWSHAIVLRIEDITPHEDTEPAAGTEAGTTPQEGVDPGIPGVQRLEWAVALHRALVKRIGIAAPSVITGHYGPGVHRPANRIAIQYISPVGEALTTGIGEPDPEDTGTGATGHGSFLLLVPRDAGSTDLMYLEQALHGFTQVWSRHGIAAVRVLRDEVSTAGFWRPPAPGLERRWFTDPAMAPDIRRQGKDWTLADSALVSVGFVYRDELPAPTGRGDQRYRAVAKHVTERGVRVLRTHRLTAQTHRYTHRLPEHVVAQPYVADLDLGDLHADDGLLAIGQSRHLGGGLLLPLDIPQGMEDRLWGTTR